MTKTTERELTEKGQWGRAENNGEDREGEDKEGEDREDQTAAWKTSIASAPSPTPRSLSRWSCPLTGREQRATHG